MKIFLSIVIVLLLCLCGWIRFTSTRPTELHRTVISGLKAELKDSRAEFDASREVLASAKEEIENLKRRLASLEESAVARSFSGQDTPAQAVSALSDVPVAPAPVAAAAPARAGTMDGRLSELQATFETHRLSIENRKKLIEVNLAALKTRRRSVENTDLHFSEQSTRLDVDGNVMGNRGVRTSSADRERAKAKIADQVAEVDREISKRQVELNKVVGEMASLRDNYSRAISRARKEFGPGGVSAAGD